MKKNETRNNLILLNIVIFYISISLSNEKYNARIINSIEEIILTISGPGNEIPILNNQYNHPPNEIEINNYRFTYSPNGDQNNYKYNLDLETNIVKLYYNSPPDKFNCMFQDLNSLTKVDLSNFHCSNAKDMSHMFENCNQLTEIINLNNIITSSVTNMESLFQNCFQLTSLDISNFDTSKVVNMRSMFFNCQNLENLDLSNFNTNKVGDMSYMFSYCSKIKTLDLSNFKATNTKMECMFNGCLELESIIFQNTDTFMVNNMKAMFQNCYKLTSVDLSKFDTSQVTDMALLFDNCHALTSVDLSSFNTALVEDFTHFFSYCNTLEALDLSNFDTANAKKMDGFMMGCLSLIYANLNSLVINDGTTIEYIFDNLPTFTKLCYNEGNANLINSNQNLCGDNCFLSSYKLLAESKQCVSSCIETSYKFEYNNKCYNNCPEGTILSNENLKICKKKLVCKNYYNIDKTECFDEIPEDYFISDPSENIIDKCYNKCKKCNEKGTENDNKCTICKNNFYFYKGNCLDNCPYSYYSDDLGNRVCTCTENSKCKECSSESLNQNKCISCNDGYYPKEEERNNEFKNCYDKLEGYFLDENDHYLKKCYSSCKECTKKGDKANHSCSKCIDNFDFIINEPAKKNNCYKQCGENYYYFEEVDEYKCTTVKACPDTHNKLIINKNKCIDDCSKDHDYKYEYKNECYQTCPGESTTYSTESNICLDPIEETEEQQTQAHQNKESAQNTETPQNTEPVQNTESTQNIESNQNIDSTQKEEVIQNTENIKETQKKEIDNWSAEDFFLGNLNDNNTLSKDDIKKNIEEDIINHNLDTIISNVIKEKEDIQIKEDNALYQITTSENQNNNKYSNISSIKLGECEKILKDKYNISRNETLIILKIDYNVSGLLIPIIGYEVFHPKYKYKLNLSYCEESHINYDIPVSINEDYLYKYNPNSEYYTDSCNTYTTENGTDILINDRKNEFTNNNMSLCENICEYEGYEQDTKKAFCKCGIRYKEMALSELDNNSNLLANNFTNDNSTSNFGTMKCSNTLFSKDGLLTNYGSYILLFIFGFHIISIFIFYKCGYTIIETSIDDMLSDKKKMKNLESNNNLKKKQSIFNAKQNQNQKPNQRLSQKLKPKSSQRLKQKQTPKKSIFIPKINRKFSFRRHNKEKTQKKRKSSANPLKRFRSKSTKNCIDEQSNINNDSKSFTQMKFRNSKIIPKTPKRRSKASKTFILNIKNIKIYKNDKGRNLILYNNYELNNMTYKEALLYDKRTFMQYYISLIKTKHPIIFSFCPIKDLNVAIIKACIFFLTLAIYFAFNTIFFDLAVIHKIYEDGGNYNLAFFFPQIFYSFIISYIINIFIKIGVLSERSLLEIKQSSSIKEARHKAKLIKKCLIIKNICYFILSTAFLILFWYYLSSFCAVYQNSQYHLIKNTIVSFCLGLIFPFIINFIPVIFRNIALGNTNRECIYKASQIFQLI